MKRHLLYGGLAVAAVFWLLRLRAMEAADGRSLPPAYFLSVGMVLVCLLGLDLNGMGVFARALYRRYHARFGGTIHRDAIVFLYRGITVRFQVFVSRFEREVHTRTVTYRCVLPDVGLVPEEIRESWPMPRGNDALLRWERQGRLGDKRIDVLSPQPRADLVQLLSGHRPSLETLFTSEIPAKLMVRDGVLTYATGKKAPAPDELAAILDALWHLAPPLDRAAA